MCDAYQPIITLYHHTATLTHIPFHRQLLTLPLPPVQEAIDSRILSVISTYLGHALAAVFNAACALENTTHDDLDELSTTLHTQDTFLRWIPSLQSLPTQDLDPVITRAFSALSASTSLLQDRTPEVAAVIYRIRLYGILCLVHASPAAFDPSVFWSQAAKFANSYILDVERGHSEDDVISAATKISLSFDQLVERARQRTDAVTFFSGRGYIAFCQYWMSIAKRVRGLQQ